jgi:uncharacterized protein YqgQ
MQKTITDTTVQNKQMEDILKKVDTILNQLYPNQQDKQDVLEKIGEIVYLESMEEIMEGLDTEEEKDLFADMLSKGETEKAFQIIENHNKQYLNNTEKQINVDKIFTDISTDVLADALGFPEKV